jgi:hypothetical protein
MRGSVPVFGWSDSGNLRRMSVKIVGLRTDIFNMGQPEFNALTRDIFSDLLRMLILVIHKIVT